MFFGKKKEEKLGSYGAIVWEQFRRNRLAIWSLRFLYVLIFIAITGDFIANNKPIYCKLDGQSYFPIFKEYANKLGISQKEDNFFGVDWHKLNYEAVIFPLIPYSANEPLDRLNPSKGPFDHQNVQSKRFWHWLGTDQIGRDVAAAMVSGTRTALLVGLVAMSIATIIGVFLGAIAGYFGDQKLQISRIRILLSLLAILVGIFYGFIARSFAFVEGNFGIEFIKGVGIVLLSIILFNVLANLLKKVPAFGKKVSIPADILVMRFIEIMNSIPPLLLLLSVVALIENQSIIYVMVIIGLIRWTGIARFTRAEILRIRSQEYIEATKAMGFSDWRIIIRHALPNALTPVLITVAFGIANAILLEAFLSFLGIGVPSDQVTWGSLLSDARDQVSAWWLAIFPGMAIFVTVTIFNLIGEGLTDALSPK